VDDGGFDADRVSVRIKLEAGVEHAKIQAVVVQFASEEHWQERTGGIGFPLVEDIPQDRRDEFMMTLAELAPEPGYRDARANTPRTLSAAHIWPSRLS
jgi:hypothetical protein